MKNITTRKIFLGSNTPDGFIGFMDSMVDNYPLEKIYILKGGSGVGKSTFIKRFADKVIAVNPEEKLTIEYIMCSADPTSFDGVIIHELGIAIIDGTNPHITDPKYPGVVEEIIDLAKFLDTSKLSVSKEHLRTLMNERKECFARAYHELNKARDLHMQVEKLMSGAMDFQKVDALLNEIAKTLL